MTTMKYVFLVLSNIQNKETFINDMEKFISLEGRQKISHAEIHLKVKTLVESKTWEELCQTGFEDVVNLLDRFIDNTKDKRVRLKWKTTLPLYSVAPWHPLDVEETWKLYSDLMDFAHKYSLPRLIDHCEL